MFRRPDPAVVAGLRARIAVLEKQGFGAPGATPRKALALGLAEVDDALPWGGLPRGRLHEVGGDASAAGFCAALLGRAAADGAVLWCLRSSGSSGSSGGVGALHGPGLAAFGLEPGRLIVVSGGHEKEVLWAMEEGLRHAPIAAVVGEVQTISLVATRRLQLAAEAGGGLGILLRSGRAATASAATTRWDVSAAASAGPDKDQDRGVGRPRWRVHLAKCRGGVERAWTLEWHDETHRFAVVAPLADRPAEARPRRRTVRAGAARHVGAG